MGLMSDRILDLFFDCLERGGKTPSDIEVIYSSGLEITWEDFIYSGTGLAELTDSSIDDVVIIGDGSWWVEIDNFEYPEDRQVRFFSLPNLEINL